MKEVLFTSYFLRCSIFFFILGPYHLSFSFLSSETCFSPSLPFLSLSPFLLCSFIALHFPYGAVDFVLFHVLPYPCPFLFFLSPHLPHTHSQMNASLDWVPIPPSSSPYTPISPDPLPPPSPLPRAAAVPLTRRRHYFQSRPIWSAHFSQGLPTIPVSGLAFGVMCSAG